MLVFEGHTVTGPCGCEWPVPPPGAMVKQGLCCSLALPAATVCVDVCGSRYHRVSWESWPWWPGALKNCCSLSGRYHSLPPLLPCLAPMVWMLESLLWPSTALGEQAFANKIAQCLFILFFFGGGDGVGLQGCKGGAPTWRIWEIGGIGVYGVKFPKNQ